MPIVTFPIKDNSRMLVGASDFFCPVGKEYKSDCSLLMGVALIKDVMTRCGYFLSRKCYVPGTQN